jgi:photosystem II stability/assembly factor-like uncharacterized protein
MVSHDRGRTWTEREPPAPVLDLVVDPRRSERVLAATEQGLFESDRAGREWRMRSKSAGLLAWPAPTRLYAVDGRGRVFASADSGGEWTAVGDIGGEPAALLAAGPRELYVALHDGTIRRSTNGGASWSRAPLPRADAGSRLGDPTRVGPGSVDLPRPFQSAPVRLSLDASEGRTG